MKIIKIFIEKSKDGGYCAYSDNEAITGMGDTVTACKQDISDCIETLKMFDKNNRPKFLDEPYRLVYKFDTESLLNYYKGIFSAPAFERMTGINQKQIHHYATGLRKPRISQKRKIEKALHELGEELIAVEL